MTKETTFFFTAPRGLWQRDQRLKRGLENQGCKVTVSNSVFSKFSVSQSKLRPLLTNYDNDLFHTMVFLIWILWDNIIHTVILLRHIRIIQDCDIVYAGNTSNYSVFAASFFSSMLRKPLVYDPHDGRYLGYVHGRRIIPNESRTSKLLLKTDVQAMKQADVLITESNAQMGKFSELFNLDQGKMCTLYTGANEDAFNRNLCDEDLDVDILYWGTYIQFHKVELIFEAAQQINDDVSFVFAGKGNSLKSEEMRKKLIRRSKSIPNIQFVGWLDSEILCEYISSSEITLGYFGNDEKIRYSVSNTVGEAAYFGKTILTSRSPAITEVFTDGEDIIMCDPNSKEAIVEKIEAYQSGEFDINEPDVRETYSKHLSAEASAIKLLSKI